MQSTLTVLVDILGKQGIIVSPSDRVLGTLPAPPLNPHSTPPKPLCRRPHPAIRLTPLHAWLSGFVRVSDV